MDKILKMIDEVFKSINEHNKAQDSVGLLEDANRLSSLRYNLANYWVEAKLKAEQLEEDYKNKVASRLIELRKEKKTIDEAKAEARIENSPDYCAFLEAEKEKNKLTALRDDLATKVSVLQSYSSELRAQRINKEL